MTAPKRHILPVPAPAGAPESRPGRYILMSDIHGNREAMETMLCDRFGYDVTPKGKWKAPKGTHLVIAGDLINRGEDSPGVVRHARALQEQGNATIIRGNHEHEVVTMDACWTQELKYPFWIPPEKRTLKQHYFNLFQDDYGPHGQQQVRSDIEWFKTLPLFGDFDTFRVAHASYTDRNTDVLRKPDDHPAEQVERAAYETVMGVYFPLHLLSSVAPDIPDRYYTYHRRGNSYGKVPVKSWLPNTTYYENLSEILLLPFDSPLGALAMQKPAQQDFVRNFILPEQKDKRPLFLGHYQLYSPPAVQNDKTVVLDFHRHMTAYVHEPTDPDVRNERLLAIPL